MAIQINAGEGVKRTDEFLVDPLQIKADNSVNGRWLPHDEVDILAKVRSFEQHGQLQPVVARRLPDKTLELVMGWGRRNAAIRYNELHPDSPMKLRVCVVDKISDEEALCKNIAENRDRKATTPMDDAINHVKLRKHGWSDKKIAEDYGYKQAYVSQLKKLLSLPPDVQMKVHSKEISVGAAISLASTGLSAQEQQEAMQAATVPGQKKLSTEGIKRYIREKKQVTGKGEPRTIKEIREYLHELEVNGVSQEIKGIASSLIAFVDGRIKDETLTKRLCGLFDNGDFYQG